MSSWWLVPLIFAAAASGNVAREGADEVTTKALASDEDCEVADGECGLSALQLRSERLEETAGEKGVHRASCQDFGCGASYRRHRACQCNSKCTRHRNCCHDYASRCEGAAHHTLTGVKKLPPEVAEESVAKPAYENFTLVLSEDFDSPLDLDNHPIWTWSDGGLIEGQVRFAKEAIKFEDGKMKIEVSNKQYPSHACSHAESGEVPPKKMTSGEMRTKHNMFRYGRYEVRMKAPDVQAGDHIINGNYVSTMFVFRDAKYKHWREIDFELTGDNPNSITTNVLSADNTVHWSADIAESEQYHVKKNLRAGFHTYAIEWLPDRISWYVDGKLLRSKGGGHLPISDKSAKIMLNLWVFDDRALFGGSKIRNNRYPMHSEYDWFRFYKWDGDQDYPCKGLGTSCLTKDDMYLSSNNPCDGIAQVGTKFGSPVCKATCSH